MEPAVKILYSELYRLEQKIKLFQDYGWNTILLEKELNSIENAIEVLTTKG